GRRTIQARLPLHRLPAQDRLSDEGRPAAEGAGDPRQMAQAGPVRQGPRGPRRPRQVHPPRRSTVRQWRHAHRPCAQPHSQGHGGA
ncbi:MAG: Isoleucyl-tRNA synthetase, partial [uncultured Sphingomonas sp.]